MESQAVFGRSPMADQTDSGTRASPSYSPESARLVDPTGRAAIDVSLGFMVDESEPGRAAGLCDAVTTSVPPGVRVEFLVLDDHTNPRRRELVGVVDQHGDAVRLVPRPAEEGCVLLEAVSQSSQSDFVVLAFGDPVPWGVVSSALGELWADGADVVAVGGVGAGAAFPSKEAGLHEHLAECVGLTDTTERGGDGGHGRFVLLRRWAARWLFGEIPRGADVREELADRARLLGLRMLVLDAHGRPVTRS